MKNNLKDVQNIKESLDEFKEEYQKVKAETDFYMKKLKEDFGCKDIDETKKLRDKLIKEVEQLQEEFDTELSEIKEAMEEEGLL
jgi:hypothetical protein